VGKYNCLAARCPSRKVLAYISDKWTVMVLVVLIDGTQRFNELRRRVQGITQKMLTRTLRDLEENGIVSRRIYAEVPPRVEYTLSEIGESLRPVIETLRAWGEGHRETLSCAPAPDALTTPDRAA